MNAFTRVLMTLGVVILSAVAALAGSLPDYQLQGSGTGTQGSYLVTVSVLGSKKNINDDVLARCAVHGVLFKGFVDSSTRKTMKPLAGSASVEGEHADYFENFFDKDGAASNYVTFVNSSRQIVKSGKQYKVSVTVSVSKDQLRKDLQDAGVIRSLNSAF